MNVCYEVMEAYKSLNPKGERNTVLSAFVVRDRVTECLTVCSLATGTKSLPYTMTKEYQGKVIGDLHAEVLAQRGFIRFLKSQNLIIKDLFVMDEKRGKLQWNRDKYELIFYSSQPPCGDCSIQQKHGLYSGARPLKYFKTQAIPDEEKYRKSILRTKPSRLDLPVDKRSLSLCCSDKLMLWNVLGVQGKRLFGRFKPIYIDRVVIEKGEELEGSTIKQGMSLRQRVSHLTGLSPDQIHNKLFKLKINGSYRSFTHQFRCNQPQYSFIPKQFNKDKVETSNISLIHSASQKLEEINGKTGLLQGASLKQIKHNVGVSSYSNLKLFQEVQLEAEKYQYWAVKTHIKELFGEWKHLYS